MQSIRLAVFLGTAAMNETATCEKIEQLEQRHLQLLSELDALNGRLEQTLSSFGKPDHQDKLPNAE